MSAYLPNKKGFTGFVRSCVFTNCRYYNTVSDRRGASSILRTFNQNCSTGAAHVDVHLKDSDSPLDITTSSNISSLRTFETKLSGSTFLFQRCYPSPNNINAAGIVIRYWDTEHKVHIAVWMVIFTALGSSLLFDAAATIFVPNYYIDTSLTDS
jgi:hypothetical protein